MTEVKPATDAEDCDWCGRIKTNHMGAYYYGFDATGTPEVDRILCSVASAGKAYHHTDGWSEGGVVDLIQNAAKEAATKINSDRAEIAAQAHLIAEGIKAVSEQTAEIARLKAEVERLTPAALPCHACGSQGFSDIVNGFVVLCETCHGTGRSKR